MTTQVYQAPNQIFSKIDNIPDLLNDDGAIVSLYTDEDQVLHLQCRLRKSGYLVLFPVTFRLINRYLNGDYTLGEVVERAPCTELLLVTKGHNLLPLDKSQFDISQLSFSNQKYPGIRFCKVASVDEIRKSLHECMRG